MPKPGDDVYLQIPGGEPELHRGTVRDWYDVSSTAVFGLDVEPLSEGLFVHLYHELEGRFHRQAARVCAVTAEGTRRVVAMELTGEPVFAERRRQRRVAYFSVYDTLVRALVQR